MCILMVQQQIVISVLSIWELVLTADYIWAVKQAKKINFYNNVLGIYVGRMITVNIGYEMNVIVIDSDGIVITKPLFMNDNQVTGLGNPLESRDATNK